MSLALIVGSTLNLGNVQAAVAPAPQPSAVVVRNIENIVSPPPAATKAQEYDTMLAKLHEVQRLERVRADEAAKAAAIAAQQAQAYRVQRVVAPQYYASNVTLVARQGDTSGSLFGSIGYAFAGGNCVNQIGPSVRPDGNPITWAVTTQTPYIGAAGLFPYNHVVRVVGLWSNGDIEVANENWSGVPQTRFPRSAFRGFR